MKVIVQKMPDITALLMDNERIVVSATGSTELEAIGRLVATHPDKFTLTEVTGKRGPIDLD